jgi:predicted nucleic acid-binding protein
MTVFVDTSGIYAIVDREDPNHSRAAAWLAASDETRLVTHVAAMCETTALIDRRLGPDVTNDLLDDLFPFIEVLDIDARTRSRALASFRNASGRRRASLVDLIAFELMRAHGISTAFAFDDHFERAGFKVVPEA